jgi:hypothetical protein
VRAAALVLVLSVSAIAGDAPAPRIVRNRDFLRQVERAVANGVKWLQAAQSEDGSYPDWVAQGAITALAYHTMRVCGVPPEDPVARRAWDALLRGYRKDRLTTYSASLLLLALASHGDRSLAATDDHDVRLIDEDKTWAAEIACCLAAGQSADGTWSYNVDQRATPQGKPFRGTDKASPSHDHSNTQFALLGLKAAARCGVEIDASVWSRSLAHFLAAQEPSGPAVARAAPPTTPGATSAPIIDHARGWGYVYTDGKRPLDPYASMTAAGVSSVVICRSDLVGTPAMTLELDAASEQSVWDGLAWLGTHWPTKPRWDPWYEQYGMERAGVLAGVERMAGLDWYACGAVHVAWAQSPEGWWVSSYGDTPRRPVPASVATPFRVIGTCFALLFLTRGTTPVHRGCVVTPIGDDLDINFEEAAKLTGAAMDDFLDLVLKRRCRTADVGVVRRLFDGATSAGPKIVEPLVRRLDDKDAGVRAAANELLRRATRQDFGFVSDASFDARQDAVAKWQGWWLYYRYFVNMDNRCGEERGQDDTSSSSHVRAARCHAARRDGERPTICRTRRSPRTERGRSIAWSSRALSRASGIRSRLRSGWRMCRSASTMRRRAVNRRTRCSRQAMRTTSSKSGASSAGAVTTAEPARRTQPAAVERGTPMRVASVASRVSCTSRTRRWSYVRWVRRVGIAARMRERTTIYRGGPAPRLECQNATTSIASAVAR